MATKKKNIVFFHPDLGIGGAERLVVDAAVGLQNLGHKVTIFTSYCDPGHCFDEARDGTLDVRVRGNSIIPPSLLGRFAILCAILRQLHLFLQISVLDSELQNLKPDAFFIDQLSAIVPFLRLVSNSRVLFYCHFPDKLLAQKGGLLKALYRIPFDLFESWTTGSSDVIVVNSKFTRGIFGAAFPHLKHRNPSVVYPCVDVAGSDTSEAGIARKQSWTDKKVLLSINRFERKKDVGLAIKAFAGLAPEVRAKACLVIAGGYDKRIPENVAYHIELDALAASLGLHTETAKNATIPDLPDGVNVLFLLSVSNELKNALLGGASLLIYTPKNEHFGIVPLEAMLAGTPVVAANLGGPTETVVDGMTGWLLDADVPAQWTEVMKMVVSGLSERKLAEIGQRGRTRVVEQFSKVMMARRLDGEIDGMLKRVARPPAWDVLLYVGPIVLGVVLGLYLFLGKR